MALNGVGRGGTRIEVVALDEDDRQLLRRRVDTPRGDHAVFAVILGTGAGAGIAVDGRAHHGPNHSAHDPRLRRRHERRDLAAGARAGRGGGHPRRG